jgi:hypothetical protein
VTDVVGSSVLGIATLFAGMLEKARRSASARLHRREHLHGTAH